MSREMLILSEADVGKLISRALCRDVLTAAFRDYAAGTVVTPKKIHFAFAPGPLIVGPAYVPAAGVLGLKMANIRSANREVGLPAAFLYVPLFDAATGRLIALLGGETITRLRTAAASAVASQALARPDSCVLGIIGPGVQGREHAYALAEVFRFDAVYVAGGRPASVARLAAELSTAFPWRVREGSVEEVARAADILVTATPATTAVVHHAWVRLGTHINAVGADRPDKQELDPAILQHARIVVDSYEQCLERGEVHQAIEQGRLSPQRIAGGLGDVLQGRVAGRTSADEITVFDSTGVYFEDVAVAQALYAQARAQTIGVTVEL